MHSSYGLSTLYSDVQCTAVCCSLPAVLFAVQLHMYAIPCTHSSQWERHSTVHRLTSSYSVTNVAFEAGYRDAEYVCVCIAVQLASVLYNMMRTSAVGTCGPSLTSSSQDD